MNGAPASVVDSFLLTNSVALRTAAKVSISVWGAFVISLLMGFEHPIWAMITGTISFFGAEHAQVMKKCVYQCISTVLGGAVGVLIMSSMTQSPLMVMFSVASVVFICSALSFNVRDLNVTFGCAIFIVTVNILVMVPAALTPTTATLMEIYIDRVGTVMAGVVWAGIVSAALWPVFSAHGLRDHTKRLLDFALAVCDDFDAPDARMTNDLGALHSCVVDVEEAASNSAFEGSWGRRGALIAREMNREALHLASTAFALHSVHRATGEPMTPGLHAFRSSLRHHGHAASRGLPSPDAAFDPTEREETERMLSLAAGLARMKLLYTGLCEARRLKVRGIKVPRHYQARNALVNGARSAVLFIAAFLFWSTTGWGYGFLIAVVPIVFSIMFGKLPHSGLLLRKALIGALLAVPTALIVFVLVAQAPSAVEIMLVTAGPVLFLALMGLSSMTTFPYSLGYCINFLIFLLPQNVPVTDMVFAIERSLGVPAGLVILLFLFDLMPRKPTLRTDAPAARLYEADVTTFLTSRDVSKAHLERRMASVVDRMVFVITQESPQRRSELVRKAGQGILVMSEYLRAVDLLRASAAAPDPRQAVRAWRDEVLENLRSGGTRHASPLVRTVLSSSNRTAPPGDEESYLIARLGSIDRAIRDTLHAAGPAGSETLR
jgi:uncharacterized membrane protein YccC